MADLKIENFQQKADLPALEHDVLAFWDETKAFETSVESRPESNRYVFYDGPPFATGLPHYGHILASTIKDVIPRYWTMKGYRVDRVWGWDCHGIPIENMIEKEMGLKGGKKAIEELGIATFNAACRAAIMRFDGEWEKVIRRIGRWVDFKHSYKTMDRTYMESVWWAFKSLYDKGLVYEGRKVILYCPRCATPLSNFEIAMDNSYKDVSGPSTVYKYKVEGERDTYLLAWSTTPWNKLATTALAVNPDLEYVKVKQGDEYYILAKTTLGILNPEPYEVVESFKGIDLEKFRYELHYDFFPRKNGEKAGVVVADSYVTAQDGTGIVTLAVYGEDDYRVMTKRGVQLVEHVDMDGKLKPEVKPWAGMYILKADPLINEDLAKRGLIYRDEQRVHSVAVCYRCETRLYYAPVPAWFIDVQKIKGDMVHQNENINWFPGHLKHGRFGKGLETAPDWNVSRSRYWGDPMPVWVGEKTGKMRVVGSIDELKTWAVDPKRVENLTDIHREFIDDIELWTDDAKTEKGKRIPEVFDCWVESGSMPYASLHYPFENKQKFESSHPAQFIAEYIAQTRAWFYTLHVMSVGLFGKNTFENAVTTGTILAEDGTKMSKSKKNYPDPSMLFEKYGVDALRFYLMGSVVMKAENLNFSEDQVKEIYQKLINILWNTFTFGKLYMGDKKTPVSVRPENVMDRWIVSRTQSLVRDVTAQMDAYDMPATCRLIQDYVTDLSTWYLRRSRDRIRVDGNAADVFSWVLGTVIRVMAPLTPFVTELIYRNSNHGPESSVHLTAWPVCDASQIDTELESSMARVRDIVERLHAKRKEYAVGIRQPLAKAIVRGTVALDAELTAIVKDELNVKDVVFEGQTGELTVELDTVLTEELKQEGRMRDLVRKVQALRKDRKCRVTDPIVLTLPTEYKTLPDAMVSEVGKETLATEVLWGETLDISIR